MDGSDKEKLEHITGIIRDWHPAGTDVEILYAFGYLDEIPQDKYPEEWEKFRKAFSTNSDLDDPRLKANIRDMTKAKEGKWWWNPENWEF